jgi:hypothetical protein
MGLLRWAVVGATGYAIASYFRGDRQKSEERVTEHQTFDGLHAIYATREQADLAVEHLVQEHGVERATIFVEPVKDRNSSGIRISGGDAASAEPGTGRRDDAPLHGAIRLTVATDEKKQRILRHVLEEAGAVEVKLF